MKSITIGYKDAAGLTAPIIVSGPESEVNDQFSAVADAQIRHKFPEGIKRLELFVLEEPAETAQFVSDEAASYAQQSDSKRQAAIKAEKEKAALERDSADNLTKANGLLRQAASDRNKAIANVATQRNLIASETVAQGDKDKAQAKIDKDLQPKAEAAGAHFESVLASVNVLKNPKSSNEDKQKSLDDLGLNKK